MKILILGGTGRISYKVSQYFIDKGIETYLLNRGHNDNLGLEAHTLIADINDKEQVESALGDKEFDVVIDFLAFTPEDIKLHLSYFQNHPHYIFVSSTVATDRANNKPPYNELTPLGNPYSEYGENKAKCERYLKSSDYQKYTIVRPSHTFDERAFPVLIHGKGTYTIIDRMINGKKIPLLDDGSSLWPILYAGDFPKALHPLLLNEKAYGETYNLTPKETHSWKEIFIMEGSLYGVTPNFAFLPKERFFIDYPRFHDGLKGDKAISTFFDNAKIESIAPEFKNQTPLLDALKITKNYVDNHSSSRFIDDEFNALLDEICKRYV